MDAEYAHQSALMRVCRALASLKLTLMVLVAIGVAVLSVYFAEARATWILAGPLTLFAVNIAAAVATNPALRHQTPLLVFHLALIAIVLLIAIGRLTYLKGTLELTNGIPFDGELSSSEAGPLHFGHLDRVKFINEGFEIDYEANLRRGITRNKVRWLDDEGKEHTDIIGDQEYLELKGYKFYTSFNKGFAPVFVWMPDGGGDALEGSIHLPSYPLNQYRQALEWTPPGTALKLWTQLQFVEVILDPAKPSKFRLPERYKIVIRHGQERYEMQPGDSIKLPGGVLMCKELTSWMGYTVFYDRTISWLFAASITAVLSLGWHFWRKFAARPWKP